ncbi:MAG TPA: translation initiation factor IF-2, partial [Candidatus Absconditabacterales bacterium]|nr:translation initiation factor IF-2 [Candidatus Absconditabacterales bacterium]
MPRIIDVVKDLGVNKSTFSRYYEKVMGKELTSKTVTVSGANLVKIKKLLEKNGKIGDKKNKKDDKSSNNALKAGELMGGGFLAGLGFEKKVEESIQEDDPDEEIEDLTEEEELEVKRYIEKEFEPEKKEEKVEKPKAKVQKKSTMEVTADDIISHSGRPAPRQISYDRPRYNKPVTTYNKSKVENKKTEEEKKEEKTPIVKKPKKATTSANLVKKDEIVINSNISVKEFSEKMGIPLPEVMKVLMQNKMMLGITANLDFDTASLIAEDLGVIVKKEENQQLDVESFMSGDLQSLLDTDKNASHLEERAPIVTIMGHVDHGKTTLLDYLRKTSVADQEAGGITQGIGASVAECNGKKITFIDTPGHELFTDLRSRGAKLTNVAVIVVAADDSVMPQTVESINHAKSAGVPIIIAITKIDKPGKNIDQIKNDLAAHDVIPEDWGGDVPIVGISGISGQGIPELLELILLQSEILELKYNPDRSAIGVVLDAHKDPKQGVVSSVIVMTGTLNVGDIIVAYNTYGKVRRMQDWTGKNIDSATGGEPVQILGITHLPEAGRMVEVVKNEKDAHKKIDLIKSQEDDNSSQTVVQDFLSKLSGGDEMEKTELKLILKSDGSSSLEALKQAIAGIKVPDNVDMKVIHSDVGHFSESDLSLAQASKALILGFNISINSILKKKAEQMKIEMKNFDIIYELTNYLTDLTQGMIKYEEEEVVIGKLDLMGVFYTKGKEMVVGGKVIEGKVKNKSKFRIIRGEEIIANGEIKSLHKNKDEMKEISL